MMNNVMLFTAFLVPVYLCGYAFGRLYVPWEIRIPLPIMGVARLVFIALTSFLILRAVYALILNSNDELFAEHVSGLRYYVAAYADVTVFTLGTIGGYAKARHYDRKSIKTGLAVTEDGGIALVSPFDEGSEYAMREQKAKTL